MDYEQFDLLVIYQRIVMSLHTAATLEIPPTELQNASLLDMENYNELND